MTIQYSFCIFDTRRCTILDFFHPWPKTALIQVARKYLAEINPEIFSGKDEVRAEMKSYKKSSTSNMNTC